MMAIRVDDIMRSTPTKIIQSNNINVNSFPEKKIVSNVYSGSLTKKGKSFLYISKGSFGG